MHRGPKSKNCELCIDRMYISGLPVRHLGYHQFLSTKFIMPWSGMKYAYIINMTYDFWNIFSRIIAYEIGNAENRITVIVTMALVTNAKRLERNVDVIMFAARDSSAPSAFVEESLNEGIILRSVRRINTVRRDFVVPKVTESLCANLCWERIRFVPSWKVEWPMLLIMDALVTMV